MILGTINVCTYPEHIIYINSVEEFENYEDANINQYNIQYPIAVPYKIELTDVKLETVSHGLLEILNNSI